MTRPIQSHFQRDVSIAVIIPYYNGSVFIERAIKSVLNQTIRPDEILVVNDGSTDAERLFLHQMAERLDFKVIDRENGGQGAARNTGVAFSKSSYICFLDQDDFYLPTHNQILAQAIPAETNKFGWVYADLYGADGDGKIVEKEIVKQHGNPPKSSLHQVLGTNLMMLPSASLISREAFEQVGGFDEQFMGYEDDDLFIRLFREGYSSYFIPEHVTVWCMHSQSTSNSIRMSRSRLKFFKKWHSIFPDNPEREEFILRDCLVPRFHADFVGDAMAAIIQNQKLKTNIYTYRSELSHILNEYANIVMRCPSISITIKLKLKLQRAIISLDSKTAVIAANITMKFLRITKSSLLRRKIKR